MDMQVLFIHMMRNCSFLLRNALIHSLLKETDENVFKSQITNLEDNFNHFDSQFCFSKVFT